MTKLKVALVADGVDTNVKTLSYDTASAKLSRDCAKLLQDLGNHCSKYKCAYVGIVILIGGLSAIAAICVVATNNHEKCEKEYSTGNLTTSPDCYNGGVFPDGPYPVRPPPYRSLREGGVSTLFSQVAESFIDSARSALGI